MRSFIAFTKKELTEQFRTYKFWVTAAVFLLLGIMNPAVAKLTPLLLEFLKDAMAESGMTITVVSVSALDSWVQFFKNMPIGIIVFILIEGSLFTKEYSKGTLILSLTRGLERYKVILSKSGVLLALWSLYFWSSYVITYLINILFWDNSVAQNLALSAVCWWLFGIFAVSLITLFSVIFTSYTGVLLGMGGAVLVSATVGLLPKVNKFMPSFLTDGNSLIYGVNGAEEYIPAIIVTCLLTLICFAVSIPLFNKKQL